MWSGEGTSRGFGIKQTQLSPASAADLLCDFGYLLGTTPEREASGSDLVQAENVPAEATEGCEAGLAVPLGCGPLPCPWALLPRGAVLVMPGNHRGGRGAKWGQSGVYGLCFPLPLDRQGCQDRGVSPTLAPASAGGAGRDPPGHPARPSLSPVRLRPTCVVLRDSVAFARATATSAKLCLSETHTRLPRLRLPS